MSPETSVREVFERLRVPGAVSLLVADAVLLLGALANVVTTSNYGGDLTLRLFRAAGTFLSLATVALPVVALLLVAVVRPVRTLAVPGVAAAAVAELGAAVVLGVVSILAGLAADLAWQTRLIGLAEALGWLAVFLVALLGSVQTLRLKRDIYAGHGTTVGEANGGLAPEARWGANPQPEAHQQAPQQPAATGRAAAPQVAPPPPGGQYAGQFEPPPGQGYVGQSHAGQPSGSHQAPGAPGAWPAQAPRPGQASWPVQQPQPGYPSQAPPQPPYPGPPAPPSAPPPPPSAHEPPPPPAAPPPAQPPSPRAHQPAPPQAHQTPPPAPQAPGPAADTGRPPAQSTTFVRASDLLPNLDELSPGPDQPIRSEQRPAAVPAQPGPSVEPPTVGPTETGPGIADAEPDLDEDDTVTRAFRVSSPEEPPAR